MKGKNLFTRRTVSNMIVVAFGIVLFMAMSNFSTLREYFGWITGILKPFIVGLGMAYLLNLPMRFFENKVFKNSKRKSLWSLIVTYVLFILLLVVLVVAVLPQLIQSVTMLATNIPIYIGNIYELTDWLTELLGLETDILDVFAVSYDTIMNQIFTWLRTYLPDLVNMTVKVGSGVISVVTAFIASLYMLASRDKLLLQTRRVLYAMLPRKKADEVYRISRLSNQLFSGFISGKLLDSLIIGIITYVFMSVMNLWVLDMPFAPLISIIIGVTNIIPFFGPFIGAIPSVLILLLVNPMAAVWFIVFVIVLQQFDGNFLGPKILGESTGLPALWVLIAIVVGGGLFGFAGMVLGVPTVAVLYTLASDSVAKRLKNKGLDRKAQPVPAAEATETDTSPAQDARR